MLGSSGPLLLLWSAFSRRCRSHRTLLMKSRKNVATADSCTVGFRNTLANQLEMWIAIRILILNIPIVASLNSPKSRPINRRQSNSWYSSLHLGDNPLQVLHQTLHINSVAIAGKVFPYLQKLMFCSAGNLRNNPVLWAAEYCQLTCALTKEFGKTFNCRQKIHT